MVLRTGIGTVEEGNDCCGDGAGMGTILKIVVGMGWGWG